MKISSFMSVLAIALAAISCYDIEEGTPDCIVKEIKKFSKGTGCDDRSVGEHEFQGKTVYAFSPGTCGADMGANVYDSDCGLLGMLGGFTGNTKINGEEFSNAVFVQMIWEKK